MSFCPLDGIVERSKRRSILNFGRPFKSKAFETLKVFFSDLVISFSTFSTSNDFNIVRWTPNAGPIVQMKHSKSFP